MKCVKIGIRGADILGSAVAGYETFDAELDEGNGGVQATVAGAAAAAGSYFGAEQGLIWGAEIGFVMDGGLPGAVVGGAAGRS